MFFRRESFFFCRVKRLKKEYSLNGFFEVSVFTLDYIYYFEP